MKLKAGGKSMSQIMQLAYHSRVIESAMTVQQLAWLRAIMKTARTNNSERNITGCLIFDTHCFVQVLEGEAEKVLSLFEKISADSRHRAVTSLGTRMVMGRSFTGWSMKAVVVNPESHEVLLRHGLTLPMNASRLKLANAITLCSDLAATFSSGHLAA
jgi:Sensors of blue-light using FAD